MEVNGRDDLKAPLLSPSDSVAITISEPNNKREKKTRTVRFRIGDIKCASCATSIESVLAKLNGVENAVVSPLQGEGVISYTPELVNAKKIKETIEDAGFPVDEVPEQDIAVCQLRIKGMMCTSCSESVERALLMVDGVKKAAVGLALEEAKIHFDPNLTDTDHIMEAIEDAGFGADLISSGNDVNKVHLTVDGINSPEDVATIRSSLESAEGVSNIEMDLGVNKVSVTYDPDLTGPRSIISCIQEAGQGSKVYNAHLYVAPDEERLSSSRKFRCIGTSFS
ncbi:hypothetical protein SLA2020_442340 [Shorea laevis]